MSATAFKRLNVSDNFVVPYTANKSWDIPSQSFADKKVIVNIGSNLSESYFDPNNEYFTNGAWDRLVYESINLTYYPGFLPIEVKHNDTIYGTIYNDGTLTTQSYYNGYVDLGNKDTVKFFPTGAGAAIFTVNIPKNITGDKILPGTLEIYLSTGSFSAKLYDDGNYNLFYSGSNTISSLGSTITNGSYVGNVFYEQNVAIITVVPSILRATAWRGKDYTCAGNILTYTILEQYYTDSGYPTGLIKANTIGDPDYIAPASNPVLCPIAASPPSTPSVTPTVTPTLTPTPSVTPSTPTYPCQTFIITNNGFGNITYNYLDCSSVAQSIIVPNKESRYVCSINTVPGKYGFYDVKLVSNGCNIPVSPSPTPTVTITPSITPSITTSPASGGTPNVVEYGVQLFSCAQVNDYIGFYLNLDRVTPVNVSYTLRIEIKDPITNVFLYYMYVTGIILAGSSSDTTNFDPCDGGGIYIGGLGIPGDFCIQSIDTTVTNSFCTCGGICVSITPTPSVTPSITPTPSVTPSITPSVTPSITPTISVTPSITPSPSTP